MARSSTSGSDPSRSGRAAVGPWFASARERWLWGWTASVVIAIFATLGLARSLSDELNDRNLADTVFGIGMVLIAAALIALAVARQARLAQVGVGLGVAAVYLLVFARMGTPEERTHLIEYTVVALLVHEALIERRASGRAVSSPARGAFAIAVTVGVLDELVQLVLPSRVFDWRDIAFNTLAAALAIGSRLLVARVHAHRINAGSDPGV